MEKKIYFAYGSNLNHRQMAYRCPGAEFVGTGVLKDFTLTFKGDNSGVADIIPCDGGRVPIGVWKISPADERRLDIYEGFPRLYGKRTVRALCGGKPVDGMVYIMSARKPVKLPSETYFNAILEALQNILCKSKTDQASDSLQRQACFGIPSCWVIPAEWNGMRAAGVNTVSVCGNNIKRGNQIMRSGYQQTLSKAGLKQYPSSDILCSNVTRCFSTQDTKFFSGCRHW